MDGAAAASSLGVVLQIIFLDLLLSGDNALVIALACRRLPTELAQRAAWIGAGGAILLRLFLTLMTGALLSLPFVQLLSAFPLLVIALNLMNGEDEADAAGDEGRGEATMLAAIGVIIVSDVAMSLDNVVALAAVSGGNFWLLAFGLALSVPLIVFGSFGFSRVMQAYPLLTDFGAGLLGWVAGGMISRDPWLAGWIDTQAPALDLVLPLACAIFVVVQGRFARQNAAKDKAKRRRRAAPRYAVAPVEAPQPALQPAPGPEPMAKLIEPPAPAVSEDRPAPAREGERAFLQSPSPEAAMTAMGMGMDEEASSGDRLIIYGLAGLFLLFGVFLLIFILVPD
ncbi:TerC family protein [Rhodoblastus acidophilus]|uniref:TerC family protein n=1 Tax=Candidatus Rhodoblastus alkanivorans TaxID=2954117 RepID=A0ABS9Z767_9HYPH|nr:TerC family protein [Candidatus Rhodoblastus alkanivorans]MCI4678686.1 TerC family protein [Candidatus Rhodoblastus alkanivorans]MCI4683518.1 TerC family protein [Candidatus Rhodoblastus alkanivorans]MDI4640833.1 TerC family protein [Rhodoblastus acidophilus]